MKILSWKNQTKERYVVLAWNHAIRSFMYRDKAIRWCRHWLPKYGVLEIYDMQQQMVVWDWIY